MKPGAHYQILSNIELLALEPHETLRHHRPKCICLNEFMFKAGIRIPFEFRVAALLQAFCVVPMHIIPNSRKSS
ncbi:hypothetical protein ACLOJK_022086 [Asimina triloba]